MTYSGVCTAQPEIPVCKTTVQNQEDELKRDLGMLLRSVVNLVIAKAALRNAAGDDPPEIILSTAFLEPDAFELVMVGLSLHAAPA